MISVWCGRPGEPPAFTRRPEQVHYAASLIKLAVLLAAYRADERGDLGLDDLVPVRDELPSTRSGTFRADPGYDNDEEPWRRLGQRVPLRWLCRRMIISSSNLATDLLIDRLGLEAVAAASPPGLAVRRPIGDTAARAAGVASTVTAGAVADLLAGLATGRAAGPAACAEMLAVLRAQLYRGEIPAALPPGTPVANKNGWTDEVRHDAALISPADAPPYVLAVCTSGLPDPRGQDVIRGVAAASWEARHDLRALAGAAAGIAG